MSIEQKIQSLVGHPVETLAHGYLRYEALRKFSPRQYAEFWHKAMSEDKTFDALVDELIEKEGK